MNKDFFSKSLIFSKSTDISNKNIADNIQLQAKRLSLCSSTTARELLSYQIAKKLNVLPLTFVKTESGENILSVATELNNNNYEIEKTLTFCTNSTIKLIPIKKEILCEAVFISYQGDDQTLIKHVSNAHKLIQDEEEKDFTQNKGSIASFLDSLIEYAISHQASDIHFIPTATGALLRLRINGSLRENREAIHAKKLHQQLISRIKILSGCSITRLFSPFDSSFIFSTDSKKISIRVSIMPTIHGEKAVLRFLSNERRFTLEELNLDNQFLNLLKYYTQKGEGAILFSGPTGSGKTTSIYALLMLLLDYGKNIITLEDPVEIELNGISQTTISEEHGFGFKEGLKAILRQDPDVIMLGEIRENNAAQVSLHAALTGHLLLSTVHTRSVLDIPLRLSHFGVDNFLLSQSLSLLVSQRLIPRLCNQCKVIDLSASKKYKSDIYQPCGCATCDYSGYDSRIAVMEILIIDEKIREALSNGEIAGSALKQYLTKENYIPFEVNLLSLLKKGLISENTFNNFYSERI